MTPPDLERFRKLLGMLGSDQAGERAAAALKATEWLKANGLSWSDVTVPGAGAAMVGVAEVGEAEMARRREDIVRASGEARAAQRRRNRERWAQSAAAPDANGFFDDLREDIRRATGGEDGLRDPRVRK